MSSSPYDEAAARTKRSRVAVNTIGAICVCVALCVMASETPAPGDLGQFDVKEIALPDASGIVSLDYFAYDSTSHRLWVPASNTGRVDIIDGTTDAVTAIAGFTTAQVDFRGKRPSFGPSSVTIGSGVVYVGNRADATICVIDAEKLVVGNCLSLGSTSEGLGIAPDALSYIAATRELWLTRGVPPLGVASADLAITVLDASHPNNLKLKGKIALGASAEGFAVDNRRGRFYTSLEETGETLSIDVKTRAVVARWHAGCDEPHGLALDSSRGILFVACTARVVTLDVAHAGRVLGSIDTGAGLDNIDYAASRNLLFAAASDDALLTVAHVDKRGVPKKLAAVATVKGARGVVAGETGSAYVMDPIGGRILKIAFPKGLSR